MRSIVLSLALVLALTPSGKADEPVPAPPEAAPTEAAPTDVGEPTQEVAAPGSVPEPVPEPEATPEPPPPAAPPPPPPPLLIEAGELTLRPRLQARMRYEGRINPYGDGVGLGDQHFVTARARIGLDARWRVIRVVAEVQDVGNFGTFPGSDDGNRFAMHQGFIEVGSEAAYVRLGRQEVTLGDERYVGPLDWQMAARSFDALRVHAQTGIVSFDGFGAMLRGQATYTYAGMDGMPQTVDSRGDYFAFAQLALKPSDAFTFEGYTMYRHDDPIATAPTRDRDVVAPGFRVTGTIVDPLTYVFEGQVQLGRTNGERHVALAGTADLRYAFQGSSRPTLGIGANYATGNHASQQFDEIENFFPTNHKFYGYADLFGLRNLIESHATIEIRPTELPVRFYGAFHTFALEAPSARWTNAGGAQLGVSQTNEDRFLGTELDATFAWTAHPRLVLSGGYSIFVPATGAENLGHDEIQHWFFLMLGADTQ